MQLSRDNAKLAHTDPLTGMPNRRYFVYQVNYELERAQAISAPFAVGVLDLDHFKPVNDTYGHKFGDRLLTEVGERLKTFACSLITICRLGGDEFGLIIRGDAANVQIMGQKICDAVAEPYMLDETRITVGCSCGLALFPDAGRMLHELFDRSDYALYPLQFQTGEARHGYALFRQP